MDRPSRIGAVLASFYALSAALHMTVWWAARLEYLPPPGPRDMIAAFAPALPWYLLGAVVKGGRGRHTGITMTAWTVGVLLNVWLVFVASRYVGRRLRISWVRAA